MIIPEKDILRVIKQAAIDEISDEDPFIPAAAIGDAFEIHTAEGMAELLEVLDSLVKEDVLESTGSAYRLKHSVKLLDGYPVTDPCSLADHLSYIPQPWQDLIRQIDPNDVYVVTTVVGTNTPFRIARLQRGTSAKQLLSSLVPPNPNLRLTAQTGTDIRTFLVELARAQGLMFTHALDLDKP